MLYINARIVFGFIPDGMNTVAIASMPVLYNSINAVVIIERKKYGDIRKE